MPEKMCDSKFEVCLGGLSKDDAWMLTYIIAHMLKDRECIRHIYQMLTGDNYADNLEVADNAIDFILLDSLGHGNHTSNILRHEGINTERELVKFVYTRGVEDLEQGVFHLGPSALSDITAYMNIRNIIPKDSDMSDVISHFMKGAKAATALRLANIKYISYMEAHI